jgi:hypothetical protein
MGTRGRNVAIGADGRAELAVLESLDGERYFVRFQKCLREKGLSSVAKCGINQGEAPVNSCYSFFNGYQPMTMANGLRTSTATRWPPIGVLEVSGGL